MATSKAAGLIAAMAQAVAMSVTNNQSVQEINGVKVRKALKKMNSVLITMLDQNLNGIPAFLGVSFGVQIVYFASLLFN